MLRVFIALCLVNQPIQGFWWWDSDPPPTKTTTTTPPPDYSFSVTLLEWIVTEQGVEHMERFCIASAIAPQWVLTAAHCVNDINLNDFKYYHVLYGETHQSTPILNAPFQKVIPHPSYRNETKLIELDYDDILFNDIALVKTNAISTKGYGKILDVGNTTLMGLPVLYFGAAETKDLKTDEFKPVDIIDGIIIKCNDSIFEENEEHVFCISPKQDKSKTTNIATDTSIASHAGGPLLHDNKIIGVCAYGWNDIDMEEHVYTSVAPYIEWITLELNNDGVLLEVTFRMAQQHRFDYNNRAVSLPQSIFNLNPDFENKIKKSCLHWRKGARNKLE